MAPYPIEPHNPWAKGPRKKSLLELMEEEETFARIIVEQQNSALKNNQNLALPQYTPPPSSQQVQDGQYAAPTGAAGTPHSSTLSNADYLIISYGFFDGNDLDTLTSLVAPATAGPVGFCAGGGSGLPYLEWGGDNMGTGVESALINVNTLKTDFPTNDIVDVYLSAIWFSTKVSGNVTISVKVWQGGTNAIVNFEFINTGGTLLGNVTFPIVNVPTQDSDCPAHDCVGTLRYVISTGALTLLPCPP